MANIIQDHLPSSTSMTVDLSEGYSFPTYIAATDLRPDIVWWNDDQKTITLVELTVCFETSYEAAMTRKEDRYHDLIAEMLKAEYTSTLITVEVGSRGLPNKSGFWRLSDIYPQAMPPRILQTATGHITASHPRVVQDVVF